MTVPGAAVVALMVTLISPATDELGFIVMHCYAVLRGSPVREEGLAILSWVQFVFFFEKQISDSPLFLQLLLVLLRSRYRVGWL